LTLAYTLKITRAWLAYIIFFVNPSRPKVTGRLAGIDFKCSFTFDSLIPFGYLRCIRLHCQPFDGFSLYSSLLPCWRFFSFKP